jgi:hypothetical protein
MEIVLALVGVAAAIGVALWQNRRSDRAEQRLNKILRDLSSQLAGDLSAGLLSAMRAERAQGTDTVSSVHDDATFSATYADVDGDGRNELLIQYPAGAHGSVLQVFGWRDFQFQEIGQLGAGTPVGFDIKNVNKDGRIEIVTDETDWSLDLPYEAAARVRIWYRWEDGGFVEHKRQKLYSEEDIAELRREYGTDPSGLPPPDTRGRL